LRKIGTKRCEESKKGLNDEMIRSLPWIKLHHFDSQSLRLLRHWNSCQQIIFGSLERQQPILIFWQLDVHQLFNHF
jgi:hypothetical protein